MFDWNEAQAIIRVDREKSHQTWRGKQAAPAHCAQSLKQPELSQYWRTQWSGSDRAFQWLSLDFETHCHCSTLLLESEWKARDHAKYMKVIATGESRKGSRRPKIMIGSWAC